MQVKYKEKIREIVNHLVDAADEHIDEQADLYTEYNLGSLEVVELIIQLEETFQIQIDDYELDLENFRNLGSIASLVEGRINVKNEF